jgi:hypothetical protein
MAFLIPKPDVPKVPPPPSPRSYSDAEIAAAAENQRRKLYGDAPGRRATLGLGGLSPATAAMLPTSYSGLLGIA